MTAVNFLLASWNEQQKVFFNNLAIIRKRPTKDAVHDLRVSVKKLRSYLRLQQKITSEEWKYQFSPAKLLFTTLGKFRDFDMSLSLLKKYHQKRDEFLPDFKKYLQVNRSLARQWVKKAVKNFKEEEFTQIMQLNKPIYSITDAEIGKEINKCSANMLKKATSLAKDFKKQAHEIRKLLKDVYYWLMICPNDLSPGLINVKKLDKILDELGSWQDLFIFRKKLTHFRKEVLPGGSEHKALVRNLEQEIIMEQDALLEKAGNSFKKINK